MEDGKEPPSVFYEQPDILDVGHFYWDAFHILGSERVVGMAMGPIPYSVIRLYADEYGIVSRDEFSFFLSIIQRLDAEYLSLVNSIDKKTDMVPISDVDEQHRMFNRLKARAATAKKR